MTAIVMLDDDAWEDVEEGTLAVLDEWFVREGDSVTEGQPLASVMLVKTAHEVTAPVAGVISTLYLAEEEGFTRGQPLLEIQ